MKLSKKNIISRHIGCNLIQLCFVVKDFDEGLEEYSRIFGAGPWFVYQNPPAELDKTVYRGRPSRMNARVALAYAGDMMYEIAAPIEGQQSIFSEVLARRGSGIHHFGFAATDFKKVQEYIAENELEEVSFGVTARGARCIMVERQGPMNAIEEYIEILPDSLPFYDFMKKCAREWDGSTLIYEGAIPQDVVARYTEDDS